MPLASAREKTDRAADLPLYARSRDPPSSLAGLTQADVVVGDSNADGQTDWAAFNA